VSENIPENKFKFKLLLSWILSFVKIGEKPPNQELPATKTVNVSGYFEQVKHKGMLNQRAIPSSEPKIGPLTFSFSIVPDQDFNALRVFVARSDGAVSEDLKITFYPKLGVETVVDTNYFYLKHDQNSKAENIPVSVVSANQGNLTIKVERVDADQIIAK
jgi:hypothetical protein